MKLFPPLPESTKEIKSHVKMTNVPPEGNVKMKVLKSKIKKTASLSEKSKSSRKFLQSTHVDKNEKVNCYKKKFIIIQF